MKFYTQCIETLSVLENLRLRPPWDIWISTEAKQDLNQVQRQHSVFRVFLRYLKQNWYFTNIAWHTFQYHPLVFSMPIHRDFSCHFGRRKLYFFSTKMAKNSWTVRKVGHEYGLDPKPIREVTKSDDACFLNTNK